MSGRGAWAFLPLGLLLVGCPTGPSDPAPPATKPEIPQAPPGALGALAAGTDAAPEPERSPGTGDPSMPLLPPGHGKVPPPTGGGGGGAEPDAGAAEPDAGTAL